MGILFVLPPSELPLAQFQRALETTLDTIKPNSMEIAVPGRILETYKKAWPDQKIIPYEVSLNAAQYDAIVFLEGQSSSEIAPLPEDCTRPNSQSKNKPRLYKINYWGRLTLLNQELDKQEYPFLNEHVFNRLSQRLNEGFYYFPYSYLYRYPGIGPINELGYRITQNLAGLESRDPNHKLIAVFGGSAAFSIYCRHKDMFTAKLEYKLNEYCVKTSKPIFFSVLNFSTPGHVVLNEITTFTLFGHNLKPEIVIAHDGYNDFYYGQISDPHLLNWYALTYQNIHEKWSQTIFDTRDVVLTWSEDKEPWWENKFTILNYPRSIIAAYCTRQLQFQQIVEGSGTTFIGGLQPSLFSRIKKSPQEQVTLQHQLSGMYGSLHKGVPFLYEKYFEHGSYRDLKHFLNFPQYFGELDDSHTLLADCVHTTPEGDEAIAEIYFNYICAELLPDLVGKR